VFRIIIMKSILAILALIVSILGNTEMTGAE
jgi:hypothetical protein